MTGIDELRRTLDSHAHDLHDDRLAGRAADVRTRVRHVRRQRAAGVGLAAVLAVTAAGVVPMLGGDHTPVPAERQLIGKVAPATMTSLGYTYGFVEGVENDGSRRAAVRLPVSDEPRLLTWAADAAQVTVDSPYDRETSAQTGFDDFTVVRPEESGRWAVSAGGADVALAVYELEETPPGTRIEGATVFRERVGSEQLVDVALGKPGQMDVSLPLTLPDGPLRVVEYCHGFLGEGPLWVNTSVDGHGAMSSEGCLDPGYDPGADGQSTWYEPGQLGEPGETVTLRTWVSEGARGPVARSSPDARLGLAVYELPEPWARVAGWDVPRLWEHDGHLWEFDSVVSRRVGSPWLSAENESEETQLAMAVFSGAGDRKVDVSWNGGTDGLENSSGSGRTAFLLGPGEETTIAVGVPVPDEVRLGYAFYERVD